MKPDQVPTDEPLRRVNDVDVRTPDQSYPNANVEMYPFWTKIFTDRHQETTPHTVWEPNVRVTIEE